MKVKCFFIVALLLVVSGCTTTTSNSKEKVEKTALKTSTYVTDSMKKNAIQSNLVASGVEYTPKILNDNATDIALVTIKSIDKADMDFFEFVPGTYGKLVVVDNIAGNIKKDQEYQFVKPGGYVTEEEFEKNDDSEAILKRKKLRENNKEKSKVEQYYNIQLEGDIEIESGKTYLAYFTYNKNKDVYEIIGLGNGLREVKENSSPRKQNIDTIEVKNNSTGSYESLKEYIEKSITPYRN